MKVTKKQLVEEAARVFGEAGGAQWAHESEYFGVWTCVITLREQDRKFKSELHGKGASRNGSRRALLALLQALAPRRYLTIPERPWAPSPPTAREAGCARRGRA